MAPRKLLIDCDPGHDDILAILNCLAHPEAFEILGYTTVCGNQLVELVTRNLCGVLTYLGVPGSVAQGYDAPMVLPPDPQPEAHGVTGLDGPHLPEPTVHPLQVHALDFLRDTLLAHDRVTVVALAPLTNLAMLLKTYPAVKDHIDCITLMGGSRGGGNILPRAEFNLYADPHAAKAVFESGVPIVMSDIEICQACATPHTWIDSLRGQGRVQDLAHDILQFFSLWGRRHGQNTSPIFDLVPVMHMLHPELFETAPVRVQIETEGRLTRGMTIVDSVDDPQTANVTLLKSCRDPAAYNRYLAENLVLLNQQLFPEA